MNGFASQWNIGLSLPSNTNLYQIGSMFFAVNSDTDEIWAGLIGPPYASFASLSLGLPVSSSRHAHTHSVASGLYSHSSKGKVINYGEGEGGLQNGKAIEVLSLQTEGAGGGGKSCSYPEGVVVKVLG